MSTSRKRRRAAQRRLAKASNRHQITLWTIVIIVLLALAFGIARIFR